MNAVTNMAAAVGRGLRLKLVDWGSATRLLGLLLGFAMLAKHFEESCIPALLPNYLPDDWKGGFVLLVMIFVLSSFLDNIAAAMIGGAVARTVFRGKVHIGYLAAIVAAYRRCQSSDLLTDILRPILTQMHQEEIRRAGGAPPVPLARAAVGARAGVSVPLHRRGRRLDDGRAGPPAGCAGPRHPRAWARADHI